jgi:Zn-dependent protease with chaperone function
VSELTGYFYDGRTAERHAVTVEFSQPGYIVLRELGAVMRFPLSAVETRPQLGGQPAVVELPGQARLEVADADAFFAALKAATGRRQWQHAMESRWTTIVVIALLTLGLGLFLYEQGIPTVAKWTATIMPAEIEEQLGREGLLMMDRNGFEPSALSQDRRQRIRTAMQEVIDVVGQGDDYNLVFRGGKNVGPNAFTLPAGTIIFTDEFVRLASSTDELRTIMAHEVGHARNHHVLRMVLQKSLLAGLITVITGDIATAGSIAIAIPKFLLEASYSREFEFEADAVAQEYLRATGKPLTLFADIMGRFEASHTDEAGIPSILSTHPATAERVKAFLD